MSLVIFDLDNTLIKGDSDHSWGTFLAEKGLVDVVEFTQKNDAFYADYQAGILDIVAYQRFALSYIEGMSIEETAPLHQNFMQSKIQSMMLPKAKDLILKHKNDSDDLLIITATNRFVTGPIAKALGIDQLIATEPEIIDGIYTGEITGVPSYQKGKITRLNMWLENYDGNMEGSTFYSDSFNDLPLLCVVDRPIAVDPDDTLRGHAQEKNWEIISLRG